MRIVIVAVLVGALGALAYADDGEVRLRLVPGPAFVAELVHLPAAPASELELRDGRGVSVRGEAIAQPAAPLDIAIVMEDEETWLGRSYIDDDDGGDESYPGALKLLKQALQMLDAPHLVAPGSRFELITYGERAEVKIPMGPVANFVPEALGVLQDYHRKWGTDLVSGVALGLHELQLAPGPRRLLIVLGDGTATDTKTAAPALGLLGAHARARDIDVCSIVFKTALSEPGNVTTKLDPCTSQVSTAEGFAISLRAILARATTRPQVWFPAGAFAWTGEPSVLELVRDGIRLGAPIALTLGIAPDRGWSRERWACLLVATAGSLVALGLFGLARRRSCETLDARRPSRRRERA